jgi:nitric oxide reductase activation protein
MYSYKQARKAIRRAEDRLIAAHRANPQSQKTQELSKTYDHLMAAYLTARDNYLHKVYSYRKNTEGEIQSMYRNFLWHIEKSSPTPAEALLACIAR